MSSVKLFKLVTQPINSSTVTKQKWSLNVLSPVSHHPSLQSSRRWLWPRPLLPQPGRAGSPALPLPAPPTRGPRYHHLSRASSQKAVTHCALPCMQLFLRAVCVWGRKKWGGWGTESRALFQGRRCQFLVFTVTKVGAAGRCHQYVYSRMCLLSPACSYIKFLSVLWQNK